MPGVLQVIADMRDRVARMGTKLAECRQIADALEEQEAMDPELEALMEQLVAYWEARKQNT